MPALTLKGVSACYGELSVLKGIDLEVSPGEICGLIGPNGAGKSTLLRSVLDLGVDVDGDITICGHSSGELSSRQRAKLVSFLPQNFNPLSGLSVFETVLLGRHPYRSGWAADSEEDILVAREVMEETGILNLKDRIFSNLSGGEKRLVMLASALAQEPSLLLLDEPGSSLDFKHQLNMWLLLKKLSGRGIAILVSTHEVALAGRFLDSVLILNRGCSQAFGSPGDVFRPQVLSEVFDVDLHVTHDEASNSWVIVPRMSR